MRDLDIPKDQLKRIDPTVEKLAAHLREVLADLPEGPESAIQFRAGDEP